MKIRRIFICFFSLFSVFGISQQKKDTAKVKWHYQPNFMVGADVLNGGLSFFRDRKVYQGFVSTMLKKNLHAAIDVGFEKNIYQKNNYDASVSGPYLKLGAFYMLAKDPENQLNGFFAGGKLAGSVYKQEYFAVPVRGYGGSNSSVAFPSSTQSSYWLEGTIGGRVQLFSSHYYIEMQIQPRYLLYSTKQDNLKPMIVPGFGKSSTNFNLGVSWSLAYSF